MSNRLHHVGIVCRDREGADALLELLGLKVVSEEYVEAYQAQCLFTEGPGGRLELIVPTGGKLAKFNKGAGGLHHIALEVDDLEAESERLRAAGVQLLEDEPVDAGPIRINFVPPAFTRGVIVELVQTKETES
ncbi:MAG: VOC family protein [Planctomycetes bacterium]|nr:VOC family protein [Planctomycetota bacterium]